ncbi:spermidine synthase [Desulfospira joergensenii]|uniref:spermidine synthase n=1 Tax=Desulfospira joergensenii TaxID=53329 RepID=UPI0003B38973|nr:spermidine synthase [Desulfospira joergensenii]
MIPWEEIDRAKVPGQDNDLVLRRRGEELSIRTGGTELMNSRVHGSEEALAGLALDRFPQRPGLKILVGGLGMGYTLAAALARAPRDAEILVSELIPAVVSWNRLYLGHQAGHPLEDPRVRVKQGDVAKEIQRDKAAWDAILLDVDNGPAGLTRKSNNKLYTRAGLRAGFQALVPGGILGVWSAGDDRTFTRRLDSCGFHTEVVPVRARAGGRGSLHRVWIAEKPGPPPLGSSG